MPYITAKRRRELNVNAFKSATPGELNYAITTLCHQYIAGMPSGKSYTTLNEVVGVLECAKLEMYRTVLAPYEDVKRAENGPVSDLDGLA